MEDRPTMLKKLFPLVILALAVGIVVPSTRETMLVKATPVVDGFRAKIVPSRLEAMVTQLNARVNRGEGMPRDWERWLDREFTSSPEDPWGNLYFFQGRRTGYVVGSMGPDGVKGTADDIQLEHRQQR